VELAWLHSREYQTALENLYSQALTLTFQRFAFALHWFGTYAPTFTGIGDGDSAVHTLSTPSTLGFTRNLAAGGQFLAEFANNFVFNFNGSGSIFMTSNLIFNLFQPLLRQFGRDVAMEPLTQSERNVLYAVRSFVRFRKTLYANVTTRIGGFLSLLQLVQSIRNQEADLERQEQNLRMHQALYETEQVSALQVDQAFQGVLTARLSLLQARTSLENALDTFKTLLLSMPPDIPIRLDDSLLSPFQLADPALEKLRKEVETFFAQYNELPEAPPLAKLQEGYRKLESFRAATEKFVDQVENELERWRKQPPGPGEDPQEIKRQRGNQNALAGQFPDLREDLKKLAEKVRKAEANLGEAKRKEGLEQLLALTREQIDATSSLFVLENQVRVYLIRLAAVDYQLDAAVRYARDNRLDLMNQRAQVVDAWRQIAVTANALKSDLNLTFNATLATPPASLNPVGFSPTANSYSVGVQFAAPLNRLLERNIYRQSLINYQAARRAFMALDDQIQTQIRRDLRQLDTDRLSFEIARRSLVAAARQVEFAEYNLRITAQAQQTTVTLDVLNAYQQLLGAKNNLIGSWVSYEQDRIQLLLDLEALQIDEREVETNESDDQPAEPGRSSAGPSPNGTGRPDRVPHGQPADQAIP
jgi:outer membrane protein TolC